MVNFNNKKLCITSKMLLSFFMLVLMTACTNIEQDIQKLMKSDVVEIQLKWLETKDDLAPQYIDLLSTNDNNLIAKFKRSLINTEFERGDRLLSRRSLAIGKLYIKEINGNKTVVDVTYDGYFFSEKRNLNMLFYSSSLTLFLKDIVVNSKKDKLLLQDGLWRNLSAKKESKSVVKP